MICEECKCDTGNCTCVPYSTECDSKKDGYEEGSLETLNNLVKYISKHSEEDIKGMSMIDIIDKYKKQGDK